MVTSVPMLVVWVISMPILSLILLYKGKRQGENSKLRNYFLILYQGLKPNAIYWEYVNTMRKILILTSLLFTKTTSILFSLVILMLSARIQVIVKPYKNKDHYRTEFLAMMAGAVTISTALIFIQRDNNDVLDTVLFIIMILINLKFIFEWIHLMARAYQDNNTLAKTVRSPFTHRSLFCSQKFSEPPKITRNP